MTAKTPEELRERMVENAARAAFASRRAFQSTAPDAPLWTWENINEESRKYWRETVAPAIDAALSAADSAGWPQSLIDKARDEAIEECAPRIAELEAALAPFAKAAERYTKSRDNRPLVFAWQEERETLTVGDLRRAALSASPKATP